MVLYYTGTGNSEYVANKIGEQIGDKVLNLFEKPYGLCRSSHAGEESRNHCEGKQRNGKCYLLSCICKRKEILCYRGLYRMRQMCKGLSL